MIFLWCFVVYFCTGIVCSVPSIFPVRVNPWRVSSAHWAPIFWGGYGTISRLQLYSWRRKRPKIFLIICTNPLDILYVHMYVCCSKLLHLEGLKRVDFDFVLASCFDHPVVGCCGQIHAAYEICVHLSQFSSISFYVAIFSFEYWKFFRVWLFPVRWWIRAVKGYRGHSLWLERFGISLLDNDIQRHTKTHKDMRRHTKTFKGIQ